MTGIIKQLLSALVLPVIGCILALAATSVAAQDDDVVIPPRTEGDGPYQRLILRGGYLIDGTGAPAQGPVDIVIEGDRITEVRVVGFPKLPVDPERRPPLDGGEELDVTGMYILPGFVDTHLHLHTTKSGQNVPPEYVLKLWLAHGVTSGRTVGSDHDTGWQVNVAGQLAQNKVTGPRLEIYPMFGTGDSGAINTPDDAREWIRRIKRAGASGVKFIGAQEDVLWAALDEANKVGLRSTMHHAQLAVKHANVLATSERGLKSMEHWYGLPEAMFDDRTIQHYPNDYVYQNEQHRFGEAGRLWQQAAKPGSEKWNEVMETLLAREFALSPTFTIYVASRDFMRMRRAEWHDEYTMPSLWDFFRPNRNAHGSYWFYWTLEDEIAWKENYRLWMQFVNEYKNRGGRVSVGSDAGYIYSTYGFGYITELALLREAGFTPLEVLHAATLQGARVLGIDDEVGSIAPGKKADLVVIRENPLENLHVLYGTGVLRLNDDTQEVERVGGIDYTIRDGIVYDARALLDDVADLVRAQKAERGIGPGPMPVTTAPSER
ncbi:MAG: amidohydrolase family protein [Woeseia sp.]